MFTVWCRHALSDCQITEAYLYVIGKSYIMLTWTYTIILNIKGKQNFKHFYYIHIVEISTQKGEHSWKYTELSLKRKEGISWQHSSGILIFPVTLGNRRSDTIQSSKYLTVIPLTITQFLKYFCLSFSRTKSSVALYTMMTIY